MRETKTVWHKWPDEKPKRDNAYLCTLLIQKKYLCLKICPYAKKNMPPWHMIETDEKEILAWAELPRPFEPEEKK